VRAGRAALGTGLKEFATRGVPRIIEASGFDYCMIDMEHGAFDLETIADLAAWFAATEVAPIVRIHKAFKARAGRAHARLKSIGVPAP
jgi:2-keto-3-deoxy-L-rhamnonate aldolase RhmA